MPLHFGNAPAKASDCGLVLLLDERRRDIGDTDVNLNIIDINVLFIVLRKQVHNVNFGAALLPLRRANRTMQAVACTCATRSQHTCPN